MDDSDDDSDDRRGQRSRSTPVRGIDSYDHSVLVQIATQAAEAVVREHHGSLRRDVQRLQAFESVVSGASNQPGVLKQMRDAHDALEDALNAQQAAHTISVEHINTRISSVEKAQTDERVEQAKRDTRARIIIGVIAFLAPFIATALMQWFQAPHP